MSERKTAVTVDIAGEEHIIRANASPEHTRRCARLVDERIGEIRQHAGPIEGHRAAILAALSIADELLQTREDLEAFRNAVERGTAALLEKIVPAAGVPPPVA